MSNLYREINFDAFSEVPERGITKAESRRLLEGFYQKAGCYDEYKRKKTQKRSIVAVCACLIVCLAISPMGDATWAAVKQAMIGIGEYLGMARQDDYATVVDQTQTKNGITVTLNDAIGSDNELRVSVTALHEDGTALRKTEVEVADLSINGVNRYDGFGSFGSDKYDSKEMHFMSMPFYHFEMPLNPKITICIYAEGELFDFSFELDNKAFKEATRIADINKTIVFNGERVVLKKLIVTPIDQKITYDTQGASLNDKVTWRGHDLYLQGVDSLGNKIIFNLDDRDKSFAGYRENEDETTYQISPDVTSVTLKAYDLKNADRDDLWNPKNAICEEFTVKL